MSDRQSIANAKYIITANGIFHSAWATFEMAHTYKDMIAEANTNVEWLLHHIKIRVDFE